MAGVGLVNSHPDLSVVPETNRLDALPQNLFQSVIAIPIISRVSSHNSFPFVEILFNSYQT